MHCSQNFYSHTRYNSQITTQQPITHTESSQKCIKNPVIKVFMYHYVREDDPHDAPVTHSLSVTPKNFDSHMKIVSALAKQKKISLMTGEDFETAMENNCFPSAKIWIFTADDGWIDTFTDLAPIAEKYQIPFIFGIISSKTNHKAFVNSEQIKKLSDNPLFTIASHTITHQPLNRVSEKIEKSEICQSKKDLEKIVQKPVNLFIYPMGKIGKNSEKFLKECGYSLAWSTNFGKNFDWNHPNFYNMNRVRVDHDTGPRFFENHAK